MAIHEHHIRYQRHILEQLYKIPRDLHIFDSNALRFCPSKVSKVGTKTPASIVNVAHGNGAIGQKLFTHHSSKSLSVGFAIMPLMCRASLALLMS